MPTYHSPSSSPSRSPRSSPSPSPRRRSSRPARSRSRRRSPSPSSSLSRSPSRSRSRSRSASRSRTKRLRDKFPDDGLSESKSESIVKTSLVFLGAVGAATLAAHKFWPKGITYGEKEEWECEQKKKAKRAIREAEDEGRRGSGGSGREGRDDRRRGIAAAGAGAGAGYAASSSSGGSGRGDREREKDRDRDMYRIDERNSGRGGSSAGGGYYAREEVIVRDKSVDPRARSQLRERSRSREREYRGTSRGPERYDAPLPLPPSADVVERRTSTRREVGYYPPSPPRLTIERGVGSTAGVSTRDRSRSVVYDDEPEVVYVRRKSGPGGRYSVSSAGAVDTARPRSRYDDGYYR